MCDYHARDHTMHGCDLGRTGERRVVFMARAGAALPRSLTVAATAIDRYREKLAHTHTHRLSDGRMRAVIGPKEKEIVVTCCTRIR